jgi:histidinol-phosphate/aromatic aminotransferase/cobyric acid decarboxylase-like protein
MLNNKEKEFHNAFYKLKESSGTHSPSITSILKELGISQVEVDACFLSNPYATELFLEYFEAEIIQKKLIKGLFEAYPPQNVEVAMGLAELIKVPYQNIFIGNGAIEIIQAIIHNFVNGRIIINIPTFSSYYEFVRNQDDVVFYNLKKENDFTLNTSDYIDFVKSIMPNAIVLINPNNPNGGYLPYNDLIEILEQLRFVENIIVDESFIHFAYEDLELSMVTANDLLLQYPNLYVIKSMSKDFGIAGIRAGFGVMEERKVKLLLKNGYLWNVSGIADYFFKLYVRKDFQSKYDVIRKKYIMNTLMFLNEMERIPGIRTFPSKANFALVEILNGYSSQEVMTKLLFNHGVYVRECSDKLGLEGNFLRIASRTFEENLKILESLNDIFKS